MSFPNSSVFPAELRNVPYQLLADTVLFIHVGIVFFVVAGLPLTVLGNILRWHWVNNWYFRVAHLAAITVVVVQAWFGQYCALTTLENWLRVQAGATGYSKSFVEHWLERLIFVEAPFWVFMLVYTIFAALVAVTWWRYPPRKGSKDKCTSSLDRGSSC
jgi:Protein of Unknown function (DUF2784)